MGGGQVTTSTHVSLTGAIVRLSQGRGHATDADLLHAFVRRMHTGTWGEILAEYGDTIEAQAARIADLETTLEAVKAYGIDQLNRQGQTWAALHGRAVLRVLGIEPL